MLVLGAGVWARAGPATRASARRAANVCRCNACNAFATTHAKLWLGAKVHVHRCNTPISSLAERKAANLGARLHKGPRPIAPHKARDGG